MQITSLLAALTIVGGAIAHPGGHEPENLQKREALWNASKRSLGECSSTLVGRRLAERAVARRSALAAELREKRGLPAKRDLHTRDAEEFIAKDHKSNLTGISQNAEPSLLFGGNTSCILSAEVTQGPYYVAGEHVRHDVRESQEGVDVYLDLQFIDINTCTPVTNTYIDIWHANATGVYSGIVAQGNGNSSDTRNLDATFLRGLRQTNDEGVVQFLTIFPGHYVGRSHHTHIVAHQGGFQNLNGTFSGGNITHVGQLFYDAKLAEEIELLEPYASNSQALTTNAEDYWVPVAVGDTDFDPFVQYVYLGETAADGILGWISIGLDTTQTYDVDHAATLTENGGLVNTNFSMGDMPGMNHSGMPMMPSGPRSSALPVDDADA